MNANVDAAAIQGMDLFTYSAEQADAAPVKDFRDPWDADEDGVQEKLPPSVAAPRAVTVVRPAVRMSPRGGFFRKGYWK